MQWSIGSSYAANRCIQIIKSFFLYLVSDFRRNRSKWPLFFHNYKAVCFLYTFKYRLPVQRADSTQIDHFSADTFFFQFCSSAQCHFHHFIKGNDRYITACFFISAFPNSI